MRIAKKRMSLVLASCVIAGSAFAASVTLKATDEVLINPGMGWVYYHFSNRLWAYGGMTPAGDTLDWFPGVSAVYLRVPWCALEPKEGEYRWDLFDSIAQPFIAKGKKIAIRVTSSESRYTYATPKWVKDAGCKGVYFKMPNHNLKGWAASDLELWDPVYDDPVFLEKLDNFLRAMAARYDGNENVAFIDVGSFGMWGEGHTGFSSKLSQEKTDEIMDKHLRLYRKHFKKTYLVVSDDVSGNINPASDAPSMKLARELGIGFRDDSIMVDPETPGNSKKKRYYHDNWARLFEANGFPVVVECEHYDLSNGRGAWSEEKLLKSVEDYQASYYSIHGWPRRFYDNNKAAIEAINRRLGYRLELRSVSWPDEVKVGEKVEIASKWVNVGVARCHVGGFVSWTLIDAAGNVAWTSVDSKFNLRSLDPKIAGKEHPSEHISECHFGYDDELPQQNDAVLNNVRENKIWEPGLKIPTLKPGVYSLCVSAGKLDATPEIALPLENAVGRRYRLGEIKVNAAE